MTTTTAPETAAAPAAEATPPNGAAHPVVPAPAPAAAAQRAATPVSPPMVFDFPQEKPAEPVTAAPDSAAQGADSEALPPMPAAEAHPVVAFVTEHSGKLKVAGAFLLGAFANSKRK